MRRVWGLFAISALILLGVFLSQYHSPYYDGSAIKLETRSQREQEKILSLPVCDITMPFKATKPFNHKKAYPKRAMRRGIEGRVSAMLRVDDQGKVRDVMILDQKPVGVFDRAVEVLALEMEYELAEPGCKGKLREADLDVEFKLVE